MVTASLLIGGIGLFDLIIMKRSLRNSQERVLSAIAQQLVSGSLSQQQTAIRAVGNHSGAEWSHVLEEPYTRWQQGRLPLALWLELFEAIERRPEPLWKTRLAEYQQSLVGSRDPLIGWRECLEGGDARNGERVFREKPEAGCVRCHTVEGVGGAIGPDLTKLGSRTERISILESIILPNALITPGFANVLVTLKNGKQVNGLLTRESSDELTLTSPVDGTRREIDTVDIASITGLPSAMPPGFGQILTKRELRDLVEFIAVPR